MGATLSGAGGVGSMSQSKACSHNRDAWRRRRGVAPPLAGLPQVFLRVS